MRRGLALPLVLVAGCSGGDDAGDGPGEPLAAPMRARLELAVNRVVTGNPPRREVVLLAHDGSGVRALTRAFAWSRAAWSPRGAELAYAAETGRDDDPETNVAVLDVRSGRRRVLTRSGRAFAPVWSPDGRTIVFAAFERGDPLSGVGMWALPAQGGEPRRLTEPERGRWDVPSSFSPDGGQLAFTRGILRAPGVGGRVANTRRVYVLDLRTLETRQLADRAAAPAFSPEGERIAFVSDRDENGELSYGDRVSYANELYVMDADGDNERRLTRTRDLNEGAPSWSPDGKLIAYDRGEVVGNAEATSVFTLRPDGTCLRAVAADPGLGVWYSNPVWRPGRPREASGCRPDRRVRTPLVPLAGNLSVAEARRFRAFGLYWLGRRFGPYILSSLDRHTASAPGGRGPTVFLHYGPVQLQLYPACVRSPAHVDLTAKRIRVRGLDGFLFEGGARLELVTGKTNVVIFAAPGRMRKVVDALKPLNPPVATVPLAPPAPGALEGRLRCR